MRVWEKVFHENGNKMKAQVAILISDKTDCKKTKKVSRDKEGYYIIIRGSIQDENTTIINTYAPNIGAPKYIKHILTDTKGETDSNIIIVRDFNTPLTSMDRLSRQKFNKETLALNDTLDQLNFLFLTSLLEYNCFTMV